MCVSVGLSVTPINITFPNENITDVSFFVQWNVQNHSTDRYVVVWTDGTTIQSVIVHETSYTVTGLTPNTNYTVNVAAVNDCTGPLSADAMVMTSIPFSKDVNTTITNVTTTAASTTTTVATTTIITPNSSTMNNFIITSIVEATTSTDTTSKS